MDELKITGVYDNVNREIYDGGVALTNEAMRKQFMEDSDPYGIVVYSSSYRTASNALLISGLIGSALGMALFLKVRKDVPFWMAKANKVKDNFDYMKFFAENAQTKLDKLLNAKNAPIGENGKYKIGITEYTPEELDKEIEFTRTSVTDWNGQAASAQFEYNRDYQLSLSNADIAKMWKYIGAGVSIAFGLMAIAGGIMKIIDLATYNDSEYGQIPQYIVDEKDITSKDENGNTIVLKNDYAYSKVVSCNRKEKGKLGDADHNWWTEGAKKNIDDLVTYNNT